MKGGWQNAKEKKRERERERERERITIEGDGGVVQKKKLNLKER